MELSLLVTLEISRISTSRNLQNYINKIYDGNDRNTSTRHHKISTINEIINKLQAEV